jgi:hypothetical protein
LLSWFCILFYNTPVALCCCMRKSWYDHGFNRKSATGVRTKKTQERDAQNRGQTREAFSFEVLEAGMIRRSAAGVFQLWLSLLACISHALSATSVVLINDDNSEGTDCQLHRVHHHHQLWLLPRAHMKHKWFSWQRKKRNWHSKIKLLWVG